VPGEQLESKTFDLAQDMISNSSLVIALLKQEIRVLTQAQPITAEIFERIQGVRRIIYDSDDYKEGIRSFFEKRKPVFQGK
jgi:methylmalonyl-CoA decarboxylase